MTLFLSSLLVFSSLASAEVQVSNFNSREIPEFAQQLTGQELVDYLNGNQNFFKAANPDVPHKTFKSRIMDIKYLENSANVPRAPQIQFNGEIPESFDARKQWAKSESVQLIRDQANCASSWAVSAASAMSDRLFVQSNGSIQTILSDSDILSCCGDYCGYGCEGGFGIRAWEYVVKNGACSGGPYKKKRVCKPYVFHPCGQHEGQPYYGECPENEETPTCRKKCQFLYKKKYEEDKAFAINAYYVEATVEAIQKEIMINGPVQASFIVYEDFAKYKGGIYVHSAGKKTGAHSVKIIGWGVENKVPYWIMANTWNSDFGEKGYFRMLRGKNECLVEEMVVAGAMKV